MWEWLIPAIAAVGSAVINLFSTKSTNDTLTENQDKQNQFNKQMLDEQNAYNSPSNQKKLYSDAGINPGFLFGGLSGLDSTSGSIPSAPSPNLQVPQLDGQGIATALFQKKRLQNETLKNEADIREVIEKSESYKIANSQAEERWQTEKNKLQSETGLSDAERNLKETQLETEKLHQQEVFYNAENLRYNLSLLEQRIITEKWSAEKIKAERDRLVALLPHEIANMDSLTSLNNSQRAVAHATYSKIRTEIRNIVTQGELLDAQVVSQTIENAVNAACAENKIAAEEFKSNSSAMNLIYNETDGMIGSILKAGAAIVQGVDAEMNYKSNGYKPTSQSSFLFSK